MESPPVYQVLARKYRPQNLEELMGQDHVTTTLRNAIAGDRVAHAYLFTGARGVGKTSSARILAKALNCATGPTIMPCNECENCVEITKGSSLDVFEIDAASNTGVDSVRELQEGLRYMPGKSRFKIYIIDEVHMLSGSAFNALLKTLEEPPAHVRFIFATTEPHKIPVTILSRCQRFDFKRLSRMRIVETLRGVLTKEKVTFSEGALQVLAREAEGSMRDALSLTDQALSYGGGSLDERTVAAALGVIDRGILSEAVRGVLSSEPQALLELVDQIYDYGYDIRQFTKNLLEHFRNLLVVRVSTGPSKLVDLPAEDIEEMKTQSASASVERLHRLFSALLKLGEDVSRSSHPRMVLEMGLVRIATLGPLQPIEELLGRLRDASNRPPPIAGGLAGTVPLAPSVPAEVRTPVKAAVAPVVFTPPVAEPAATVAAPFVPPSIPAAKPVAAPATVQPAASVPQAANTGGAGKPGESLIDYLRRASPGLAVHVQYADVTINPNEVILRFSKDQAFLATLLNTALLPDLQRSVYAFIGQTVGITVETGANAAPAVQPPSVKPPPRPQAQKNNRFESPADRARRSEAVDHPAVQLVRKIFEGDIKDVFLLAETVAAEDPADDSSES